MNVVVLVVVALLFLGGLIAIGVGHQRWNWATVVAAFLVLIASTTYLYLGTRLAARDRAWTSKVERKRLDLARVADALQPSPRGGLVPVPGQRSIDDLEAERNRWQRAVARVKTWGRQPWRNLSYTPPKEEGGGGRIDVGADGNPQDLQPLAAGARVFLFDERDYEDGGRYLGEFLVRDVKKELDADGVKILGISLTVVPTGAPLAAALEGAHDKVLMFDELPVDRWLAFYRTKTAAPDAESAPADTDAQPPAEQPAEAAPESAKEPDEADASAEARVMPSPRKSVKAVEASLGGDAEVGRLVADFIESFKTHDDPVPEDEWDALLTAATEGRLTPGTSWAVVEFTGSYTLPGGAQQADDLIEIKRDYVEGERAELDLQTALDVKKAEKGKLVRVIRRRPLADARVLLHGAAVTDDNGIRSDGASGLAIGLRAEIAALDKAQAALEASRKNAEAGVALATTTGGQLTDDLKLWQRDAEEATKLAEGFERQVARITEARAAADRDVVELGRQLDAAIGLLTAEIDRAAPPPPAP